MVAACKGWRNAVDLRHLPGGTHSLASRAAGLACPVGIPKMGRVVPRLRDTCNLPGLSGTPLLLGYTRLARRAEAQSEGLVLPVRIALTLNGV